MRRRVHHTLVWRGLLVLGRGLGGRLGHAFGSLDGRGWRRVGTEMLPRHVDQLVRDRVDVLFQKLRRGDE